jgi:acyl-coenzyme A synthetase/AMP-(fatty) acid ligase
MAYNCVDRHAEKEPEAKALVYESSMTNTNKYNINNKNNKIYIMRIMKIILNHKIYKNIKNNTINIMKIIQNFKIFKNN